MKRIVRVLLSLILWLTVSSPGLAKDPAQNAGLENPSVETFIIEPTEAPSDPESEVKKIQTGTFSIPIEGVPEVLENLVTSNRNHDLVISSDVENVFDSANVIIEKSKSGIGNATESSEELSKAKDPVNLLFSNEDKPAVLEKKGPIASRISLPKIINFTLLTVVTAKSVFVWVNASQYTSMVRIGETALTVAMILAFGLRQGVWGKMVSSVGDRVRKKLIKSTGLESLKTEVAERMTNAFVDFCYNITVQAVRMGIVIAGGSAATLVKDPNHFKLSEAVVATLPIIFGLSIAYSFAGFGWGQLSKKINGLVGHQKLKDFFNMTDRMRDSAVGYFTPNIELMSLHLRPILWIGMSGVIGLASWVKTDLTVKLLEKIRTEIPRLANGLFEEYQKNNAFEWYAPAPSAGGLRCEFVFAQ